QAPPRVVRANPIVDPNEKKIQLIGRRLGSDVQHVDARLVGDQRLSHRLDNRGDRRGVVWSKDHVVNTAAAVGQHNTLDLCLAQYQVDRFLYALLEFRMGDCTAGRDLQRKLPTDAEKLARHSRSPDSCRFQQGTRPSASSTCLRTVLTSSSFATT